MSAHFIGGVGKMRALCVQGERGERGVKKGQKNACIVNQCSLTWLWPCVLFTRLWPVYCYPAVADVLLPGCGLLMLALMTAISADVADHILA